VKIAAVFPGQGSQCVGMGVDAAAHHPAAREAFTRASRVLGYDLLELVRDGPEEQLRETHYSQPAIFVTNVALFEACAASERLDVVVSAGHSFAEFCSLTISGALSFEDGVQVVDERGRAMQMAASRAAGGMTAILGFDAERLRPIVERVREETGKCLQLANFNSPTQIVISGDLDAVRIASDALLEAGAKRIVPLNVSGAWHCELMRPAVERFAAAVRAMPIVMPRFDVISNVDGEPYRSVERIRENLVRSITDEVRWHETAQRMLSYELDLVVEFGAGGVLTPLLRRMGITKALTVSDPDGIAMLGKMIEEEVRA
jgi:[acyl-carrier-protein] S-malonyltransferase